MHTTVLTDDGIELTTATRHRYAVFAINGSARAVRFADETALGIWKHQHLVDAGEPRVALVDTATGVILKDTLNRRPLDNRPGRKTKPRGMKAATETYDPYCVRCRYYGPDKADHASHLDGGVRTNR